MAKCVGLLWFVDRIATVNPSPSGFAGSSPAAPKPFYKQDLVILILSIQLSQLRTFYALDYSKLAQFFNQFTFLLFLRSDIFPPRHLRHLRLSLKIVSRLHFFKLGHVRQICLFLRNFKVLISLFA